MSLNMLHKRSFEIGEIDILLSVVEKDSYQVEFFAMLDCLDETDRQIVVLHIVNGLKHKEIAHIIDMQPGAVRQRYARSLKLIKQNL
jgi:RNA polymerase sigma-70 factor (ECF subfamily)